MSVGITHLSYCLPNKNLSHEDLCARFGKEDMDRVLTNTGIENRKVCTNDQCASDLAFHAAEKLFDEFSINRNTIDYIIFASQMPDYLLPTTACILQGRLGLNNNIGAFDLNLGCSQFVYSHSVAYSLVISGIAKRVLVLTGDTPSRIVDPNDRSLVPLFGDGATAAIIEKVPEGFGFDSFSFGTIGKEYESLIWPKSGLRDKQLLNTNNSKISENFMKMDGQKIFLFTLKTVPNTITSFLESKKMTINSVDFFAFHQASKLIVDSIGKKLNLPSQKMNHVYQDIGNCGGSTVGISLYDGLLKKLINPGSLVLLSAFGVGLSWGHAILRIPPDGIKITSVTY